MPLNTALLLRVRDHLLDPDQIMVISWTAKLLLGETNVYRGEHARQFGLTEFSALFCQAQWPKPALAAFRRCRTAKGRAKVVAGLIDRLVEKGRL